MGEGQLVVMDMVVVVVVVLTGSVEALAMAELVEFPAMVVCQVVVPVGTEYTGVWLLLRVPSQT